MRKSDGDTCFVYFLKCGDFIKIGISKRPRKTLQCLSSAGPHDVKLLLMIPGDRQMERRLHDLFRHSRHRHEWFRATPDLLADIKDRLPACRSRDADRSVSGRLRPGARTFMTDAAFDVADERIWRESTSKDDYWERMGKFLGVE